MKRTLFIMILALLSSTLMAQERPRQAVFAEFLGASGIIGVSYDSRFKTSEHWGYRFGLSFNAGGESETFISSDKDYQGPSLLVEGNYLIGKGRHFLELGLGMMHGFFKPLFDKDEMFYDGNPWSSSSSWGTSEDWEYGPCGYLSVVCIWRRIWAPSLVFLSIRECGLCLLKWHNKAVSWPSFTRSLKLS